MRKFSRGDPPPQGDWRDYRKRTIVSMLQMNEPFECESREGTLTGQSGDYLVHDEHDGYYPVSAEFHKANYVG